MSRILVPVCRSMLLSFPSFLQKRFTLDCRQFGRRNRIHGVWLASCLCLIAGCSGGSSNGGGSVDSSDYSVVANPVEQVAVDPRTTGFFSDAGIAALDARPEALAVMFEVVENHGGDAFASSAESCQSLGAEYASCSVSNVHIKDSNRALNGGDWHLYFHNIRRILRVYSDKFSVSHVNGDLYVLTPTDAFDELDNGFASVAFITEFNYLMESDVMPRYWLVDGAGSVTLLPNTDSDSEERNYTVAITGDNRQAFNGEAWPIANVSNRYARNSGLVNTVNALDAASVRTRIVPRPVSVIAGSGELDISGGFSFAGLPLDASSIAALRRRQQQFMSGGAGVSLSGSINPAMTPSSYTLSISANGIALVGADEEALFHAAQSLLSLV